MQLSLRCPFADRVASWRAQWFDLLIVTVRWLTPHLTPEPSSAPIGAQTQGLNEPRQQ